MYCLHCGRSLASDSCFCSGCGRKVSVQRSSANLTPSYCTKCGAVIPVGTKFCHKCGKVCEPPDLSPKIHTQLLPASQPVAPSNVYAPNQSSRHICPWCHSNNITYQVINESKPMGCFTFLFYILLAITILGLLIVIPLMLRKKTETHTYAICQSCGRRWRIKKY